MKTLRKIGRFFKRVWWKIRVGACWPFARVADVSWWLGEAIEPDDHM